MNIKTDLAIEAGELNKTAFKKSNVTEYEENGVHVTQMTIDEDAANVSGMTAGAYVTCEMKTLTNPVYNENNAVDAVSNALKKYIPENGCVLVAGLGNPNATPDALGPAACEYILATRHMIETFEIFKDMRSVCVLRPGVLGQTGIEVQELLKAACTAVGASCLIAVDALAARSIKRLGCTVQMSDAGLSPGSGIGNRRTALNAQTLGIPVIAIGIPTMVNASVIAHDLTGKEVYDATNMIVTPNDIDSLISRSGRLLGKAINKALQGEEAACLK
ncbi:MAG: GPR endopeptidase [Clostridia bacterium]|nr:GPR endopeptidase [Clostridia bacterium]